jgi:phosphoserine phosphatase RsbU/P
VHGFRPGDRLLFYTDGITERMGPCETMYDYDRLVAAFRRSGRGSARAIVDAIVEDVESFGASCEAHDDQTLLVVEWKEL